MGGLPIEDLEDFDVSISPWFPFLPPTVTVRHTRFAGHPHVLVGTVLCVYRDPSREWNPNLGVVGFLNRLWDWLGDAAAGRFDASTALFHPVGGVLHRTPGAPTIVVRHALPSGLVNRGLLVAGLRRRTEHRLDLTGWHSGWRSVDGVPASVILIPGPLVFGAGATFRDLLGRIARVGFPAVEHVVSHLHQAARRTESNAELFLIVGARNPAGPLPQDHHLLVGRIEDSTAAKMRTLANSLLERDGIMARFDPANLPADDQIEWCGVSDDRPSVATRRDVARPSSWYEGKHVELWGCGGIGSWVAELLVRAGVQRITLRDHGMVTSGLLVRQDFGEEDVGFGKAEALARRLRAISDRVTVDGRQENVIAILAKGELPSCDLIIDATVNTTVALLLERCASRSNSRPASAAISLDMASATLGLLAVAMPGWQGGPYGVERQSSPNLLRSGALEHFYPFWRDVAPGEQVVPERGCSVPTFHGSAGDVMSIAATAIDILARRLAAGASGLELFASGHAVLRPGAEGHVRVEAVLSASDEVSGPLALHLALGTRQRLLALTESKEVGRVLLVGENNETAGSIWVDDVLTISANTTPEEVQGATASYPEASHGMSRYIGDAVLRPATADSTDGGVTSVQAAVAAAGGSIVLEIGIHAAVVSFRVARVDA